MIGRWLVVLVGSILLLQPPPLVFLLNFRYAPVFVYTKAHSERRRHEEAGRLQERLWAGRIDGPPDPFLRNGPFKLCTTSGFNLIRAGRNGPAKKHSRPKWSGFFRPFELFRMTLFFVERFVVFGGVISAVRTRPLIQL